VVILIKALNKWRTEHDGKAPESRADKDNFKKLITSMSTDISKEENFQVTFFLGGITFSLHFLELCLHSHLRPISALSLTSSFPYPVLCIFFLWGHNAGALFNTYLQEAHKAALKAWTAPRLPDDVQAILRDEKAAGSIPARETKVDEFWVLATALREFVEHEGKGDLPLSGAIPGIF
jgi:hypothetical protein